jgi:tRNA U34 5-carboxymethylaminomethyl modifying GTPase MnmE/TrmE
MFAAKSLPQNHLADPFEAILRPPPGETSAQRDTRILAEQLAKRVSDAIDEQLRAERAELKKSRSDVRILLLGQSESGKSTTLKRTCSIFLHLPTRSRVTRICLMSGCTRSRLANTHTFLLFFSSSLTS